MGESGRHRVKKPPGDFGVHSTNNCGQCSGRKRCIRVLQTEKKKAHGGTKAVGRDIRTKLPWGSKGKGYQINNGKKKRVTGSGLTAKKNCSTQGGGKEENKGKAGGLRKGQEKKREKKAKQIHSYILMGFCDLRK